jgi:hypothetical protein
MLARNNVFGDNLLFAFVEGKSDLRITGTRAAARYSHLPVAG